MRSARKHLTKIAATVALVAGAAGVAGVGTFGAYTDTTAAEAAVSSGKVSVLMNGSEAGIRAVATDMVPGDKNVFPVTIQRAPGSSLLGGLTLDTTVTGDAALTSALRLSVDLCSQAWTAAMTCPGTTTVVSTDVPGSTLASGDGSTNGWGPTAGWLPALNSGTTLYARATLSLPADAPANTAGLSTTISWVFTGTQRAGKTTVVNPSTLS